MAPIVACYAGKPEMLERIEEAIRVTQNNDICVAVTLAAARLVIYDLLDLRCVAYHILECVWKWYRS